MADIPASTATTASVPVNGIFNGVLEVSGDVDWIAVDLVANHWYNFNILGYSASGDAVANPKFALGTSLGIAVEADGDSGAGLNAYALTHIVTTGTYYIAVSAAAGNIGGYQVSVIEDDIPESITTPATLTLGTTVTGHTDDMGSAYDNDFYAVTLTAGHHYQFNVAGNSEVDGNALDHPYVEIINGAGTFVAGTFNTVVYTPTATATYYVNASGAYTSDNGYYDVGVKEVAAPTVPAVTPLDAIDWTSYTAPTTINVFFTAKGATVNDTYGGISNGTFVSDGWSVETIAAAKVAFANYEQVANVHFNYVSSIAQADFVMATNPNTPDTEIVGNYGYWDVGGGLQASDKLKYNGVSYTVDGVGVFNSADLTWTAANLKQGAYGYITLIHEIGHGMGLAHPHDTGGGSEVMHGVTAGQGNGDYGDFNLNQGVYSTMSYNDGWHTAPQVDERTVSLGTLGFGWQGSLMALDIAELQRKYGTNTSFRTGNDTYTLSDVNGPGTLYQSIWDAGGTDTLRYTGSKNANISLKAATLDYSATGGGVVSYVKGIHGGLTIANGVSIERAIGGTGNDVFHGGTGHNTIDGGAGFDTMDYSDRYKAVSVVLQGTATASVSVGGVVEDKLLHIEAIIGSGQNDALVGDALNNRFRGMAGSDWINGRAGRDTADYSDKTKSVAVSLDGSDVVGVTVGGVAEDKIKNIENLTGGSAGDRLTGDWLANAIAGRSGIDTIDGSEGNDTIDGGGGSDILTGGLGVDRFVFSGTIGAGNIDTITDFRHDTDIIELNHLYMAKLPQIVSGREFYAAAGATQGHDHDDRIVYNTTSGKLYYDQDGNGGSAAEQIAVLTWHPTLDAGDFRIV